MAYDEATDRRIQRMSCQKVAIEVMAPFPVTSKGEPAAAAEAWKKVFVTLCDFLSDDVNKAGAELAVVDAPATMSSNGSTADVQTLEEAMELEALIKSATADKDVLASAVKLQFVRFGVKSPSSLLDALTKITKAQAKELEAFVTQEN